MYPFPILPHLKCDHCYTVTTFQNFYTIKVNSYK